MTIFGLVSIPGWILLIVNPVGGRTESDPWWWRNRTDAEQHGTRGCASVMHLDTEHARRMHSQKWMYIRMHIRAADAHPVCGSSGLGAMGGG